MSKIRPALSLGAVILATYFFTSCRVESANPWHEDKRSSKEERLRQIQQLTQAQVGQIGEILKDVNEVLIQPSLDLLSLSANLGEKVAGVDFAPSFPGVVEEEQIEILEFDGEKGSFSYEFSDASDDIFSFPTPETRLSLECQFTTQHQDVTLGNCSLNLVSSVEQQSDKLQLMVSRQEDTESSSGDYIWSLNLRTIAQILGASDDEIHNEQITEHLVASRATSGAYVIQASDLAIPFPSYNLNFANLDLKWISGNLDSGLSTAFVEAELVHYDGTIVGDFTLSKDEKGTEIKFNAHLKLEY